MNQQKVDIAGQTQRVVSTLLDNPSLAVTARQLHISPRTLQRQLGQSGLHYSDLLEDARADKARQLVIGTNVSINEISRQLGYRDPSSFSRAFRRWTGCSPRHYRRTGKAAAGVG